MAKERLNLTGKRFHRLTVIELIGKQNNRTLWKAICDCGITKSFIGSSLVSGNTRSCGCLQEENRWLSKSHGHAHRGKITRTYKAWVGLNERCCNPKNKEFENYGARGITVCKMWHHKTPNGFSNFLSEMGECPPLLTIDRIDNNGNYEPSNCRWASQQEQASNRRNNRWIEFDGRKQILRDWAKETGLDPVTISTRIDRLGWSIERALNKKSNRAS